MAQAKIGIIGGSGLYKMEALKDIQEVKIDTPWHFWQDTAATTLFCPQKCPIGQIFMQ